MCGQELNKPNIGEKRHYVEAALRKYEKALASYDAGAIAEAKEEFKRVLEELEEERP